jgi:hypothetical protein
LVTDQDLDDTPADDAGEPVNADGVDSPPEPAYTPDFSYKVYDEQKEFPEFIRPLVTDKEMEEQVRSILCKADGLDGLKPKHEKKVKDYEELLARNQELQNNIEQMKYFAENDLDTYLQFGNVSEDKLLAHVQNKLRLAELPPEERQEYERGRKAQQELYDVKNRLSQYESQNQNLMMQQHDIQLDQALNMPEVAQYREYFDSQAGPGAFKEEITKHGAAVYYQTGQSITPMEATRATFERFQKLMPMQQTTMNAPQPAQQQTQTIPNVGSGRGVAPTKPSFKSIADLKKHAEQLRG